MGKQRKYFQGKRQAQKQTNANVSTSHPAGISKEHSMTKSAFQRQKLEERTKKHMLSQLANMGLELDAGLIQEQSSLQSIWAGFEEKITWSDKAKKKHREVNEEAEVVKEELKSLGEQRKKAEEEEKEAKARKEELGAKMKKGAGELAKILDAGISAMQRLAPDPNAMQM